MRERRKSRNDSIALSFLWTVSYRGRGVDNMHGAEYYRARAAEMMEKAQIAPTKAVRSAYLHLAQKWALEALKLEKASSH